MLIAFEGPDNVGKSFSANALHHTGTAPYNMTKESYEVAQAVHLNDSGLVTAFDRVDWLTHMAYRLALPGHEWNDARIRTVFAMPDTHLVFKLHDPKTVPLKDSEEGYADGKPSQVNDMYMHLASYFMMLNEVRNFTLFKTVTIMEVVHITDPDHAGFYQRVLDFSSPVYPWGSTEASLVTDEQGLLELLQNESQRR